MTRADRVNALCRAGCADPEALAVAICRTATAHGASGGPDHEVGDLQDTLYLAMRLLSPAARLQLVRELAEGLFVGEGWEEVVFCRTETCFGEPEDGEGWDGYCGNCADRKAEENGELDE